MNIKICENLKELRKQKGNTQEELAEYLGISMQAVSKWERGECYPDITLIPAIAQYYNATTDRLLGVDEIAAELRMKEYYKRHGELLKQSTGGLDQHEKTVALWEEARREFPNNHDVLVLLLESLCYPRPHASEHHFDEIVQICERLLAESTVNYMRYMAISQLCEIYAHKKDFENAKKYADMASSVWVSKEILYGRCFEGEELVKYTQENLRRLIDIIYYNCVIKAAECTESADEKIQMYEFAYKLYNLVYPNGDFGNGELNLAYICYNLACFYSSFSDTDKALSYISEMAEHFIRNFFTLKEFKHTSFMLNRLTWTGTPEVVSGNPSIYLSTVEMIENTPQFESLKDDARYAAALEKMKSLLG